MRKLVYLLILLCPNIVIGAQSLTLSGSSQYAVRTLSNTSPFTSVGDWRIEFRLTNITSGVVYRIIDNNHFNVQLTSTGILRVFSWNGEIADTTLDLNGFGSHLTDTTVRVQRDSVNSRYTIEAWDSNSPTRWGAVSGATGTLANRNFGNTNFYIGSCSIEQCGAAGLYFNGRIAFVRWYSTLVSYESATRPTLYSNSAQFLQYEFEGDYTDNSGNAQTLTPVNSPTFNTTPVIAPIASAGQDIGGRVAGITFSVDCSNSSAGDVGPITSYSWTRTSGSGTISSPSSVSTNITGISSGQSTFQCEVSDGTNSSTDSLDVGVVAINADGTVNISDPVARLIIGPIVPRGSAAAQVLPYYDQNEEDSFVVHDNFPIRAPRIDPQGTLSVTNGSASIVGSGTLFTKHVTPEVPIGISGVIYNISSIVDDTHITLTTNYTGSTTSGITDWHQNTADEINNYPGYWMYYDSAHTAYIAYYRTGLIKWLNTARKISDSWWTVEGINYGAGNPADFNSPRLMALGGLMLRANDGKPEYWDWINRATDFVFRSVWVMPRKNYPGLYFGLRDGGYALWWAVLLGQILPDTYTLYGNGTLNASTGTETNGATLRTNWFNDSLDAAINLYCRLQRPDGSWRWFQDVQNFLGADISSSATTLILSSDPLGEWRTSGDIKIGNEYMSYTGRSGATITGLTRGKYGSSASAHSSGALVTDLNLGFIEQTFHVGVGVGAALYDLLRILQDNSTYQAEYNTIRQAIFTNAAEGYLMGYSFEPVVNSPSINSRYMAYALHSWGDWGPLHDGMPDTVPAWQNIGDLRDARQNVVTWTHMPSYAYYYTGVEFFKEETEEILSANWGKTGFFGTIGVSDGVYGLQDFFTRTGTPNRSLKEYNEWHRYVGRAFAYRSITPLTIANKPPLVAAGRDRIFANGTSGPSFTVRAIDPEGTSLTYSWASAAGTSLTLSGATTSTVTVISALSNDTFYSLRVAVTDAAGKTTYDWVNFRTSGIDVEQTPPVANVISQNVSLSSGITSSTTALNASNSTASGGRTIHYRWYQTGGPGSTISNAKVANPELSGISNGNTYTYRVFIYDNLTRTVEETGTDAIDVRVVVGEGAPQTPKKCNWHLNPRCDQ